MKKRVAALSVTHTPAVTPLGEIPHNDPKKVQQRVWELWLEIIH